MLLPGATDLVILPEVPLLPLKEIRWENSRLIGPLLLALPAPFGTSGPRGLEPHVATTPELVALLEVVPSPELL